MKEIEGKYSKAKIFTNEIEQTAESQIKELCNQEFTKDSHIRIMPDVHAGIGCTIGTSMKIKDKIVPNLVGVDIGCGMETVVLESQELDLPKIDKIINSMIPSGFNVHLEPKGEYIKDVENLIGQLRCLTTGDKLLRSIGTLGGGNHFIEIDKDDDGKIYIVIHSGSRNLGLQVANYYQKIAWEKLSTLSKEYIANVVSELKKSGKQNEISSTIAKLKNDYIASVPKDLAYVENEDFDNYLHDMNLTQRYADYNRKTMMDIILDSLGITNNIVDRFTTVHNYIDMDSMTLRKGAVSAKKGERLIIPINMHDGSIICEGLGNDEWNQTAPHGAGRLMSRKQAFDTLSLDKFRNEMSGIYSTSVDVTTLDESPMAYKSMANIVDNIKPTAKIIKTIKPIYNFKAHGGAING